LPAAVPIGVPPAKSDLVYQKWLHIIVRRIMLDIVTGKMYSLSMNKIIPITDLRRNFGEITEDILSVRSYILTKGGRPFAVMKASPELRRDRLKKAMGAWRETDLDSDKLWKEVFKRKSRKDSIIF